MSQGFAQIGGDEIEGLVIISRVFGAKNAETIANGNARGDDEEIRGKAFIVGTGELIESLPRNEHGHDDGFSAARGHFEGEAIQQRIVSGLGFTEELVAEFLAEDGRCFDEIDGGFEGFELTEEEFLFAFFSSPVFEQVFGAAFDVEIAALSPLGDLFAQAVDENDFAFLFGLDAGEIELGFALFGLRNGDEVAGGAASIEDGVGDAFLGEGEMPSRLGERGIEDGIGDEPASS